MNDPKDPQAPPRPLLSHERLRVYHVATDHLVLATSIARKIAGRRRDLASQLERASSSIMLNIAEGAAEVPPGEKRRFYRLARRSAGECAAVLDVLDVTGLAAGTGSRDAREALHAIVAMLTRMINGATSGPDDRAPRPGEETKHDHPPT